MVNAEAHCMDLLPGQTCMAGPTQLRHNALNPFLGSVHKRSISAVLRFRSAA